ncbi:MAG TPA: hypothetical protein VEQ85_10955 [Lacipirellulaceae bacterium]|nr:hypothetical protein [Lacipirellulaceae bacterium]
MNRNLSRESCLAPAGPNSLRRRGGRAALAGGALALCAAAAWAQQGVTTSAAPLAAAAREISSVRPTSIDRAAVDDETAPDAHRLREGTQLTDHLGHFRQNGESLTFVDDDGRELGALPNLNLERVARTLKAVDEPESVSWSVSGAVTEFSGRNYLLISRAVYKAASLPPTPETLE